jgi:hypothetical protein
MYEAKRITTEAGIARSEFPLRVAAFEPLCLEALALALPLTVEVAGVAGLRVEVMTAEVVGIETFVVPCSTSKYMPAIG